MSEPKPDVGNEKRPRRLWLWFVAGFLVVFAGLAVAYPMHFYDGRAVYQTKLWKYYLLEIRQEFTSTGAFGPTSGTSGVFETAVQHVAISAVAGAVLLGIGWVLQRRSKAG